MYIHALASMMTLQRRNVHAPSIQLVPRVGMRAGGYRLGIDGDRGQGAGGGATSYMAGVECG